MRKVEYHASFTNQLFVSCLHQLRKDGVCFFRYVGGFILHVVYVCTRMREKTTTEKGRFYTAVHALSTAVEGA